MKIKIFLDNWSYEDFKNYIEAMRSGDLTTQYDLAGRLLVGWEYSVPFSEGIMALGMVEGAEVLKTVRDMLNALAEDINIDDVVIDFSAWDTRRFLEFDRAASKGQTAKVERMLHEVASIPGVSKNEPLAFQDGAKMMKAVQEAYKKLITGKN